MDVCNEKVTDVDGFCPAACDQSKNTLMKERTWIILVASELVFGPVMLTHRVCQMSGFVSESAEFRSTGSCTVSTVLQ